MDWVLGIFLSATLVSTATVAIVIIWERYRRIEAKKRKEKEVSNLITIQKLEDRSNVETLRKWR